MEETRIIQYDFFLSFAREDQAQAQRLHELLQAQGARVFFCCAVFPSEYEPPEEVLAETLGTALQCSKALLVLWSQSHSGSSWCRWEREFFSAHRTGRRLLAIGADALDLPPTWLRSGAEVTAEEALLADWSHLNTPRGSAADVKPAAENIQVPAARAIFTLLGNPRRWAEATPSVTANFAAVDIPLVDDRSERHMLLRWSLVTLAGAVALTCAIIGTASSVARFMGLEGSVLVRLQHCWVIAIGGGLVLALGHGVGAGAASMGVAALVGSTAGLLTAHLGADFGSSSAAAAAGALIGACSAYRLGLAPLLGVETPMPPAAKRRSSWWRFALGVASGYLLLKGAFMLRDELLIWAYEQTVSNILGGAPRLSWEDAPRHLRLAFTGGLGLAVGFASAITLRQRLSHHVRSREALTKGWFGGAALLFGMFALGLGIGLLPDVPPGTGTEAGAIGVLVALSSCSFYLAPSLWAGLLVPERTKALWGLGGALMLSLIAYPEMRDLPGIERRVDWIVTFLLLGLVGSFLVLVALQGAMRGRRETVAVGLKGSGS